MPLATVPQIIQIFSDQNVEGISLATWILYTVGVIPFFIYGFIHNIRHLVILNGLWLICQLLIIFGVLLYK